jgi:SPP1 family predicted phage head-tail adaptor
MIAAGKLNSRITIQSRTAGVDAIGQPVETWTTYAQVWANVKFNSGSEAMKAGMEVSISRVSMLVRLRDDITSGMRVSFKTKTYDIVSVLPDESAGDRMYLVCELVG